MVMSDEFEGSALDTEMWEPQLADGNELGLTRWGNDEQQWYLAANATVANGMLTITAKEEVAPGSATANRGSFPYTSARLRTAKKFDFTYGRVEARAKAAPGAGLWSAIWMLPTDSPYGGWAASGEVDIMEVVNPGTNDERVFQTIHHGFPWPLNRQTAGADDLEVSNPGSEFHVYAIEWNPTEIRWYIDDVHTYTVGAEEYYSYFYKRDTENYGDYAEQVGSGYEARGASPGDAAPFDTDFHILVNLAVGGTLPATVDNNALPSEFVIDYIRVFECTYPGNIGCHSNANRDMEDGRDSSLGHSQPQMASYNLYTGDAMLPEGSTMMDDGSVELPGGNTLPAGAILAESFTYENKETEQTLVRYLAVNSFWRGPDSDMTFQEVDVENRNGVIEVTAINSGNIQIYMLDGDPTTLFGFGDSAKWWELHAGELKFDMYVDSSATDMDSDIHIKMDSVWPALGEVILPVSDLPMDEWFPVSVKVNDLLENQGSSPLDTSAMNSFFVLEPTAAARVMVDNITLSCGHHTACGIRPPAGFGGASEVLVYANGNVGSKWGSGICAWDPNSGGDYCGDGATSNLVTWTETDSGDLDRGTVINVSFGNGSGGVFFFRAENSALVNLGNFETSGKLQFDLKIPAATVAAGMFYKVDCIHPCSTGDQAINLTNYTADTWQTFEFDVSAIKAAGADITGVSAVVLLPPVNNQQGLSFEVANVRFVGGAGGGGGGDNTAPPAPGPELLVYNNGVVGSDWDLGTCAWDPNSGGNYCMGNTSNQITWSETTDPDRGKVLNVNFSTGSGVFFFDATHPPGVNLSNYTSGKLLFDLKIPAATVALGMQYKVDCKFPCTSGDQTLDLSSYMADTWQTFEADVSALVTAGLDETKVNAGIVLFIPTSSSTSGSFQISHIRYDDGTRLPLATQPTVVFDGGMVSSMWGGGITAFDEAISYASCTDPDDCPSIDWELVADEDTSRGNVLQVTHGEKFAGLFFATAANMTNNMSGYRNGAITFDIKVTNVAMSTHMIAKADCGTGCRGDDRNIGMVGRSGWQTVVIPVSELMKHAESGGGALDLTTISTGVVIFPPFGQTDKVVWRLDNVHWLPTVPSSP